jgi:monoamine oxidase
MSGSPLFPGQVIERGGELIDNLHKTMLGYVKEFRLTLEDVGKQPGDPVYYFDDLIGEKSVSESKVVDEFRAFVPAMHADLRRLSPEPNALTNTPDDQILDHMSLQQYLETRGAGPIIKRAIEQAYIAEYGRPIDDQSCLNFLLFIHADRRSKFTPFGVFSDERFHIVEGNDAIARGLASRLQPGQLMTGRWLTAAELRPNKTVRLTFQGGVTADHDAVVFALPFSTLAKVDLKGLDLPKTKLNTIQTLGYGFNAKTMIGFTRPHWRDLGSDGESYSNLPDHQATWETNPTRANVTRAVLTDYSGGLRGKNLNGQTVQKTAELFLKDLELVYPGASLHVRRDPWKNIAAHREHWPSNPLSLGSYTCYRPGQFTSLAGHEGTPVGNIFFAGEHTDSFYEWQGFMEGALRSGHAAARLILAPQNNNPAG